MAGSTFEADHPNEPTARAGKALERSPANVSLATKNDVGAAATSEAARPRRVRALAAAVSITVGYSR